MDFRHFADAHALIEYMDMFYFERDILMNDTNASNVTLNVTTSMGSVLAGVDSSSVQVLLSNMSNSSNMTLNVSSGQLVVLSDPAEEPEVDFRCTALERERTGIDRTVGAQQDRRARDGRRTVEIEPVEQELGNRGVVAFSADQPFNMDGASLVLGQTLELTVPDWRATRSPGRSDR